MKRLGSFLLLLKRAICAEQLDRLIIECMRESSTVESTGQSQRQVSLRRLFLLVGGAGLLFAGLVYGSWYWTLLALGVTFLTIVTAVVVAIHGPKDRSIYWGSFAASSAACGFFAVCWPGTFPTTRMLYWLWCQFPIDRTNCFSESLSATKIIGNCLFTVLIGLIVAYAVHRFFILRKSRLSLGFLVPRSDVLRGIDSTDSVFDLSARNA